MRAERFGNALDRAAAAFTSPAMPPEVVEAGGADAPPIGRRRLVVGAMFTALLVGVALTVAVLYGPDRKAADRSPAASPAPSGVPAASSCAAGYWRTTLVTCEDAGRSISLGGAPTRSARIWLTTLAAVDSTFRPHPQVANHPADPLTPVWMFIWEGDIQQCRPDPLLFVVDATDPATRHGAFIYIFCWRELGNPPIPTRMPPVN